MFRAALTLIAALALAQAPPPERPEPRALIAQSAAAIKKYQTYHLETLVTVDMRGGQMDTHIEMPSSVSVRRPDRMRIQSKSQAGTVTIVSDGENTWFYLSAVKKYVKREAVASPEAAIGNSGLLPKDLPDVEKSIKSMKIVGEDVVEVGAARYPCWMVETTYGMILLPEQNLVIRNAIQTNWISKAERLSLQNNFSGEVDMAGVPEPVTMTQSTRTTVLRLNAKLPDSEFVFTPPATAKQGDDWTIPGIVKPDLVGKPVPQINGIEPSGRVTVVTFGAGWCAPCKRQWAELEKLQSSHPDIKVVGAAIGPISSVKPKFPVVPADESDELLASLAINSYPTTIIIGPTGKISSYEAGFRPAAALAPLLR